MSTTISNIHTLIEKIISEKTTKSWLKLVPSYKHYYMSIDLTTCISNINQNTIGLTLTYISFTHAL
jgi:hypothetical protein